LDFGPRLKPLPEKMLTYVNIVPSLAQEQA
jgi:hypothetical protein